MQKEGVQLRLPCIHHFVFDRQCHGICKYCKAVEEGLNPEQADSLIESRRHVFRLQQQNGRDSRREKKNAIALYMNR